MHQVNTPSGARESHPWRLTAAILISCIGAEVFIIQPGFVQGLVQSLGFDEKQAGYAASIEVWGITSTTLLMTFFSHRFNWRSVCAASLLGMAATNLACVFVHGHAAFLLLRFLCGAGAGGLISLGFTVTGLTDKPDRNFGYLIMWVLLYGAAGLYVMPSMFAWNGMVGVLVFLTLFPLTALPMLKALPVDGDTAGPVEADAVNLPRALQGSALVAMLLYFVAQGVMWAYLFLIGVAGGLPEQQVANGLTVSQVAGVGGAMLAAAVGSRFGRWRPLTVGILGGATSLLFLIGRFEYLAFSLWVCVYNFFWNMTHPFLLGSMASFDRRGRVVVNAVAMQMVGLAIGPALAASVITDGHYAPVNWIAIGLFVVSWLCILPPVLIQHRRSHPSRTSEAMT
ncbi:MAG: MFS transporter [Proteobacteria bacterium]|nr:MFS transporter [Pseudomonadota bacterium]